MTARDVEFRNLTKKYAGVTALDSVSFTVAAGEMFGVIGPNGAGKSTLVDLATGFTRATSGEALVGGTVISNMRPAQIARAGIVRTFQHTSIFGSLTVADNLKRAAIANPKPKLSRAAGRSHQSKLALRTRVASTLEGVDLTAYAARTAGTLPYGLQRRLEVAIALIADPDVLLLDEPAAGMNHTESNDFVDLVKQVRSGRTVLLIEHDMTVIRALCERSAVLANGHLLVQGRTADVLADQRVIEVYLGGAV